MFRLVHFLFPIYNKLFLRTILSPTTVEKESIQYHVIIDKSVSLNDILKFLNPNIEIHLVNNLNEAINISNKLKPNAILNTTYPQKAKVKQLFSKLECKNVYYIQHGVFAPKYPYTDLDHVWSNEITYIVSDNIIKSVLHKTSKEHNLRIYGIPQFDLLLNNKDYILTLKDNYTNNFKLNNKTIFLIMGGAGNTYINTDNSICQIIETIHSIYGHDNSFIFFKPRHNHLPVYRLAKNKKIKNFHVIEPSELIYNYFFADVHIVEHGGTLFIESLLVNNNTILFQHFNINNHYEYPIGENSLIMVSKNKETLTTYLDQIKNSKLNENKYKNDLEDFFLNMIGNKKILPVSDEILNNIINQ